MRIRAIAVGGLAALASCAVTWGCGGIADPKSYTLALSTAGSGTGTISASPAVESGEGYRSGTSVTVTATASQGSEFTGWEEVDVEGCREPKNPCTIAMDGRRSVVANFVPTSGVQRYDGKYTGTIAGSANGNHATELTITNGVVSGQNVPVYGSAQTFSGTVSASGTFSATISPGFSSACLISLTGTITTSVVDGLARATLTGGWLVTSTGGVGCNSTPSAGAWSATRNAVHVDSPF
jgi:hypothetical protein